MLRRCFFWLPVAYLLILAGCFLDMQFRFSGDGESNLGAWVYLYSFIPTMTVNKALGHVYSFPQNIGKVIALQTLALAAIGALLDLLGWISVKRSVER